MYGSSLIASLFYLIWVSAILMVPEAHAADTFAIQSSDDDDEGIQMNIAPYEFDQRGEILAIADRHGDLDALWSILAAEKVFERLIGTGPSGYLDIVFLGDYVDRGRHSRAVLDTVIALKILAQGSPTVRVHTLNGNHEWFLARGETSYMTFEDKGNFADFRIPFRNEIRKMVTSMEHPYRQFLRTNLTRVKIGDHVFQHAGIEPDFVTAPGPILNYAASQHMEEWLSWFAEDQYENLPAPDVASVLDPAGPFHSRRLVSPSRRPALLQEEVESMLQTLRAKRFYMGHHILGPEIQSHYQGRVITLDTGPAHRAKGMTSAAVINKRGELKPKYIKVEPADSFESRRRFLDNSLTQLPPSLISCLFSSINQASDR